MSDDVKTERVLVVPTELFHSLGHFQGFSDQIDAYRDTLLSEQNVQFRPRGEVEQDPSFKQLIPYVIFCHTEPASAAEPAGQLSVFCYTRGKGMGEGRLHSKKSVGIGGHIADVDADHTNHTKTYDEGMRRELEEEVAINSPYTAQCVGMINDDLTEVGSVHLGIVHRFDVETPDVESRETDLIQSGFVPVEEILADLSGFETWSAICLKALFGK